MKNYYIAVQICESGKYYAYVLKVSENINLLSALKIENIITANICPTKKHAAELVRVWNEGHWANGRYLFDTPIF